MGEIPVGQLPYSPLAGRVPKDAVVGVSIHISWLGGHLAIFLHERLRRF